jgi:DNA-binding GntR family transcriptional regulator
MVSEAMSGKPASGQQQFNIALEAALSLTERAYLLIRRDILTCTLEPGGEVAEGELAERLQMSKTPVREALARLQFEGLVKAIPRRGYQIAPIKVADINEIFDVRIIIEAGAIELAIGFITELEIAALERLADKTSGEAFSRDLSYSHQINWEFHEAIALASRNSRLHRFAVQQLGELERFFFLEAQATVAYPAQYADHKHIVQQIKKRDTAAARSAIVEHIEGTRAVLLSTLMNRKPAAKFMLA